MDYANFFQFHAITVGFVAWLIYGLYKADGMTNDRLLAEKKSNRTVHKYSFDDQGGSTTQINPNTANTIPCSTNSKENQEELKTGNSNDPVQTILTPYI